MSLREKKAKCNVFMLKVFLFYRYSYNEIWFQNLPEGDGVVDEECDGRCLPCCLAAILEAAAQWYGLPDNRTRWFLAFIWPDAELLDAEYEGLPPNIKGPKKEINFPLYYPRKLLYLIGFDWIKYKYFVFTPIYILCSDSPTKSMKTTCIIVGVTRKLIFFVNIFISR